MLASKKARGFSLVEVVIAVGVFAVAVATTLSLLPSMTRQMANAGDALAAQRIAGNLRIELQRLAASGFDGLASQAPVMAAPLVNGLEFVATREGLPLHSLAIPPSSNPIATENQYFLVEAWRFNQAPLAFVGSSAVLPLYVRVSWPYQNPGSASPTPLADRAQLTFTVSINR